MAQTVNQLHWVTAPSQPDLWLSLLSLPLTFISWPPLRRSAFFNVIYTCTDARRCTPRPQLMRPWTSTVVSDIGSLQTPKLSFNSLSSIQCSSFTKYGLSKGVSTGAGLPHSVDNLNHWATSVNHVYDIWSALVSGWYYLPIRSLSQWGEIERECDSLKS